MRQLTIAIYVSCMISALTIGITAAHSDRQHSLATRASNPNGATRHARSTCIYRCHKHALHKSNHKLTLHAKNRFRYLRVFSAGAPVTDRGTRRFGIPQNALSYRAEGYASWYGESFQGRRTANGEVFDMAALSAAHRTLPLSSYARVTNLENQRSVVVRVNDRGPYRQHRLIDVSLRVAKYLGFYHQGLAKVRVESLNAP